MAGLAPHNHPAAHSTPGQFGPIKDGGYIDFFVTYARDSILRFRDKGGCEFMADMAIPFPSHVFLDMMSMPQDLLGQFLTWQKGFTAHDPMERVAAARAIYAYFETFRCIALMRDRGAGRRQPVRWAVCRCQHFDAGDPGNLRA